MKRVRPRRGARMLKCACLVGSVGLAVVGLGLPVASGAGVTSSIKVGDDPTGVVFSSNGATAYVTAGVNGTGEVDAINVGKRKVVRTITVGNGPFQPVLSPDGKTLAVTNQFAPLDLVNLTTGTIRTVAAPGGTSGAYSAAFSPNGKVLYVTGGTVGSTARGVLYKVNPLTAKVTGYVKVANSTPVRLAVVGSSLLVQDDAGLINDGSGQLEVRKASTLKVVKSIPDGFSYGFGLSPDAKTAYVATDQTTSSGYTGLLNVIDLSKGELTRTISLKVVPGGLAVSPNGRAVYVAPFFGGPGLQILNSSTLRTVKTLLVPLGSIYPTFSPSGQTVYIPQALSTTGEGDKITVLDTSLSQSGARSASIRQHHAFSGQLHAAGPGAKFVVTKAAKGLSVSAAGVIKGATSLTLGVHTISGSVSDLYGDSGTWSFRLTVSKS